MRGEVSPPLLVYQVINQKVGVNHEQSVTFTEDYCMLDVTLMGRGG
jgi:hypothetical protein